MKEVMVDYTHEFLAEIYDSRVLYEPVLRVDRQKGLSRDGQFIISKIKSRASGCRLLEFGVGTGRLSRQFNEMGFHVVGVDNSRVMLEQAKRNDVTNGTALQLVHSDWLEFTVKESIKHYSACVIAYSSFLRLLNRQEQLRLLNNIRKLLEEGGIIVIDTFFPNATLLKEQTYSNELEFLAPRGACKEILTATNSRFDRIINSRFCYLPSWENAIFVHEYKLTWLYPREMKELLTDAGFSAISYHFDYGARSHESSSRPRFVTYIGKKVA